METPSTLRIDATLKKGTAKMMILSLLVNRARHGYELARLIDERSQGRLDFHVASLYPMLHRLERRGWVEGRWIEKAGQRRRRFYKLTPAGRKELPQQRASWRAFVVAVESVAGKG